jgi:hypothetical protein
MTAKEKANELVGKMYNVDFHDDAREIGMRYPHAKQCALIAVDEIISTVNICIPYLNEETYVKYWQEVKNEIEKL